MIFTGFRLLISLWASIGMYVCSHAQPASDAIPGQTITVLRATELRADKLGSAQVLVNLAAGTRLRLLSVEGGWAWVEASVPKNNSDTNTSGWVRASTVTWHSGSSVASALANGRGAAGNTALTLGIRSLPARVNRHALIIGISHSADATRSPLPGARIDKESATQMAQAMQVPLSNIQYLQDEQATGDNIRKALKELTDQVLDGDRVFIHFSGHGTRYKDPESGKCVEALMGYDSGWQSMVTNREMANLLKPMTNKADKLFVMYDACFSGGVANVSASVRTRGFSNANDEGMLRPKFSTTSDECSRPVNVRSVRNLLVEAVDKGALLQDIVHVSASRDNEMSFDDELKGGLATQFMRDCMLREAKDLDNSGAISIDEIKLCAQKKVDQRLANSTSFTSPHLVLNGNADFVPTWFSQPNPVAVAAPTQTPPTPVVAVVKPPVIAPPTVISTAIPSVKPPAVSVPPVALESTPVATLPTPVAMTPAPVSAPAQLTGEKALRQMFDQRDAKRRVQVSLDKDKLKIGQDSLDFSVQSDRAGYVYVALAGSDNKSVYLLFPNDLDQDNKIEEGRQILLPRPSWRIKAGGPLGMDNLLVMVTDAPRDLKPLASSKAGPFVLSLNDPQGRTKLGALMTTSQMVATPTCANAATRQRNSLCSDAFGAAMVSLEEVQ